MSNFAFLQTYWPDFAKTMGFAENYVYTAPTSSKNKSGLFVELMVREIFRIEKRNASAHENTASEQEALWVLGFTHQMPLYELLIQTYKMEYRTIQFFGICFFVI